MVRAIKYLLVLLLIVLIAWWYWCDDDDNESLETQVAELEPLVDRIWIDHMPKSERDKIDLFVMLGEPSIGAFSTSSAFEGSWSSFEWSLDGGLYLRMLQPDKKHKVKATVLKGAGCAPFDYCLGLKGAPLGSKRYGSMEDWVVNGDQTPDPRALVRDLLLE